MRSFSRTTVLLSLALAACGGGAGSEKGAKSEADPTDKGLNEYIAKHESGMATITGAANGGNASHSRLQFQLVATDSPVKMDGVLAEWPPRASTGVVVTEKANGHASMDVALQYDDAKLYVGGEVSDEAFYRTSAFKAEEDHASLLLAVPNPQGGFSKLELGFFAGKPGEFAGTVKFLSGSRRGQRVEGAKIVEAPAQGGYSFEAEIPWSSIPELRNVRVGLRGVVRYYDAEAGGGLRSIVATAAGDLDAPASLPWLPTESERALIEQLLKPQELTDTTPKFDILADVGGHSQKERVAVYGKYLVICGPKFMGGTSFFYRTLDGELESLEARDVTGRGRDDILLRHKIAEENVTRQTIEIVSAIGNNEPQTTFAHELSITANGAPKRRVSNSLHLGGKQIEVSIEPAEGYDATSFKEELGPEGQSLLLPWGTVKSETFRFDGTQFKRTKEVTQPGVRSVVRSAPPAPEERPAEPPTPEVQPGRDLSSELLAHFRRERHVPSEVKGRFDKQVQLGGDDRPERVVLVGRDLVVFGPGYKGGTSYTYLSLTSFEPEDIHDVSVRDLTGDGTADVIVRGTRKQPQKGGAPTSSELMMVYKLDGDALTRIFAIETEREQGKNRVQAMVQFVPSSSGHGFDIDVRPGRAFGWSQKSYPWSEESAGGGGVEPLALPWGESSGRRYSWAGDSFKLGK